jgi:hypothetical protein
MPDTDRIAAMTDEERYDLAKSDRLAGPILAALHEQDARTYHGNSGDMAGLAWATASKVDTVVRRDERAKIAQMLREHRDVFVGYGSAAALVDALPVFLTIGDKEPAS